MDFILYSAAIVLSVAVLNFVIFHKMVTVIEFVAQITICFLVTFLVAWAISGAKKIDNQIINGRIVSKWHEEVSCRHSYPCNPHDCMCDSEGHCSTCWDTCYVHSYDIDWNVKAETGYRTYVFSIDTIDSQGLKEPPRWTAIKMQEPFSKSDQYANYIKANSDSIFNKQTPLVEKYKVAIPSYPDSIYDYYKINRVISDGVTVPSDFNEKLSNLNADLGPAKQCNIVFIFLKNKSPEFFNAIEGAWIGGKKNDIVPIISVDDNNNIIWADVLAWCKSDVFKVQLRNDLLDLKKLDDYDKMLSAVEKDIRELYKRKSMKEFSYLNKTIILTSTEFTWMIVICIALCIASSVFVNLKSYY